MLAHYLTKLLIKPNRANLWMHSVLAWPLQDGCPRLPGAERQRAPFSCGRSFTTGQFLSRHLRASRYGRPHGCRPGACLKSPGCAKTPHVHAEFILHARAPRTAVKGGPRGLARVCVCVGVQPASLEIRRQLWGLATLSSSWWDSRVRASRPLSMRVLSARVRAQPWRNLTSTP
jgi:hypothetical protein